MFSARFFCARFDNCVRLMREGRVYRPRYLSPGVNVRVSQDARRYLKYVV